MVTRHLPAPLGVAVCFCEEKARSFFAPRKKTKGRAPGPSFLTLMCGLALDMLRAMHSETSLWVAGALYFLVFLVFLVLDPVMVGAIA